MSCEKCQDQECEAEPTAMGVGPYHEAGLCRKCRTAWVERSRRDPLYTEYRLVGNTLDAMSVAVDAMPRERDTADELRARMIELLGEKDDLGWRIYDDAKEWVAS